MCFPAIKILGFDVSELQWSKFGWRSLMERGWKWRRERVVIYQLSILLSLASEALATYSLTRYATHQTDIQRAFPGSYYGQNDLINAGVSAIVPSVLVAFCWGTAFFFMAQYPRKRFPRAYHWGMRVWGGLICLALVGANIACTVIVFHSSAFLVLPPNAPYTRAEILSQFPHPPLRYREYGPNVAFVILLWCALPWVLLSNLLLYLSSISDLKHGPRPIFEWTPSPSPFDLSPSPSSSARRPPPVGVFYWTRDAPEESDEVAEEVGELGESRSSDETAVGVGGEEEVSSARGEKGKGGLSGVAMMPGLERE